MTIKLTNDEFKGMVSDILDGASSHINSAKANLDSATPSCYSTSIFEAARLLQGLAKILTRDSWVDLP